LQRYSGISEDSQEKYLNEIEFCVASKGDLGVVLMVKRHPRASSEGKASLPLLYFIGDCEGGGLSCTRASRRSGGVERVPKGANIQRSVTRHNVATELVFGRFHEFDES
jgi:hypothetical protein